MIPDDFCIELCEYFGFTWKDMTTPRKRPSASKKDIVFRCCRIAIIKRGKHRYNMTFRQVEITLHCAAHLTVVHLTALGSSMNITLEEKELFDTVQEKIQKIEDKYAKY